MNDCPELAAFERAALSLSLAQHVGDCASCQFVVELLEERDGDDACSRFDAVIAERAAGGLGRAAQVLLERHLARCSRCRAVADTMAPAADAAGDLLALPEVDPANYELGLEVARGGMGRILAARDLRVGRPVAVKELLGRSRALATRFEREARVTARLQHPGIVPIYEIGQWPDGTPFYSMRMVDGRTLRQAIDAAPLLAERLRLLPALIAATDAVAFAHGKRIIHRDLTPSNILVGAYGETVVIDWGLARDLAQARGADEASEEDAGAEAAAAPSPPPLTRLGAVIGTAAYMPPEQARAVTVDERADVYALGAILYHLLAGHAPYRETDGDELLAAVRTGPPPPIADRAPGVPRDLVSIVDKAMARAPAERYPSARELSEELRRFTGGRLVSAHSYTAGERLRRFAGRHRAVLAVLCAAAVVVGFGAWVSVDRIVRSQARSDHTARTLLEERGRSELLAGHSLKALAYLGAAHDDAARTPGLDFLLASALRELDDLDATFDCGGDVEASALSPDGIHLAAACGDHGRIWRLDDHTVERTLGPAPGGFHGVDYAADGGTVAFYGEDGVARLYDTATGRLRVGLVHRAGTAINRASFDPTGARLVTTGDDGQAVVWDAHGGARLRSIAAGSLGFLGVYGVLAPDGRTLLTMTLGGVGTGWDLDTGAQLGSLAHGGQVLGGDVSRDGTLAATCGVDRRTRVWDLRTRTARLTLTGHGSAIWKCVFSQDGTRLLTTSQDGTAKVWDLASGTLVTSVDTGDFVWWGEFSPDGASFVTNTLDGAAQVWDARTGALLTSHTSAGLASHFTRDGRRLVMERADGTLQLWTRPAGRQLHDLAPPAGTALVEVARDGAHALLARGGALELWDTASARPVAHVAIAAPFALAAGGQRVAARSGDGLVVLDVGGATVATVPRTAAETLGLDAAGERLLIADGVHAPEVIDVATGAVLATATGATAGILADDGQRMLAWSEDGPPSVWTIGGDAAPVPLVGLRDGAETEPIGFSADGRRVALHVDARGDAPWLGVWDTTDGREVTALWVANDSARFDPGGTMLTAIGADGTVQVVRVDDGMPVTSFAGERITSAQIDATGTLLVATYQRDAVVSILDATDGTVLAAWPMLLAPAITTEHRFTLSRNAAWWTPDGRAIVARSTDVTLWDATSLPPGSADRVADAVSEVPWTIVDGHLSARNASVSGRVTRGGEPVGGAVVSASLSDLPRRSTQVTWAATLPQQRRVKAVTGVDGSYQLRHLPAGDFTIGAASARLGCASEAITRTMADLDQAIDLALTDCGGPPGRPGP
ncbi:MAG TPA: protein kinase [Kofleriaceae bacterium]|nr:protein kinase [Kofleriaceae bacterium]